MPDLMRFGQTDPIIQGQENYSLYQYGYNNPVLNSDPNGDCPKCLKALAKTAIKSVIKGKVDLGEVYDVIDAGKTLLDPNASWLDKGIAVFDVVSPISTKEAKAVGKFLGAVDDASDVRKVSNKVAGTAREKKVVESLQEANPNASIQTERYLRDANGKSVKDPLSGERRRIDIAVVKDKNVTDLVEVTSPNANKKAQMLKEARVREAGGTYIRDKKTKELYDVKNVETRTVRLD